MNFYELPENLPAPVADYVNYDFKKEEAKEQKHISDLKEHLISYGYNKPLTGEILREPVGDGYALYMVVDRGREWGLMHLPYNDAYHSPNVEFLPKSEVKKRIASQKKIASIFSSAS